MDGLNVQNHPFLAKNPPIAKWTELFIMAVRFISALVEFLSASLANVPVGIIARLIWTYVLVLLHACLELRFAVSAVGNSLKVAPALHIVDCLVANCSHIRFRLPWSLTFYFNN